MDPQVVLYTDRDCYGTSGISKCAQLFQELDHLRVNQNNLDG